MTPVFTINDGLAFGGLITIHLLSNAGAATYLGLCLVSLPITASYWAIHRHRSKRFARRSGAVVPHIDGRDLLTNLACRDGFYRFIETSLRKNETGSVLLISLDRFSSIVGALGHRAADEVLFVMSTKLQRELPSLSWARIGENVFAVMPPGDGSRDQADIAASAIVRVAAEELHMASCRMSCTASVGVALIPSHATDADSAMRAAQSALLRAEALGGDQWQMFDPGLEKLSRLRLILKDELCGAIQRGEIIPHYQPIMDLQNGVVVGLEVLARWQHRKRGTILPDVFIPLAEEAGLTGGITQALMRHVVADSRTWPNHLYFAFNASPGQLRELIGMIRTPPKWSEETLDPTRIEIEITESALIEDIEAARVVMALLKAQGTRVVLDDFGIGYSNFFHLRELPFDKIKIDKSFVLDMLSDQRADACVRSMLDLGQRLGIEMVAEGLEHSEVANYIRGLGCRYGQGYLFSKPIGADQLPDLMLTLQLAETVR